MDNGECSKIKNQKKIFCCILNELPRELFNHLLIYPGKLINDPIDSMTNYLIKFDLMT